MRVVSMDKDYHVDCYQCEVGDVLPMALLLDIDGHRLAAVCLMEWLVSVFVLCKFC